MHTQSERKKETRKIPGHWLHARPSGAGRRGRGVGLSLPVLPPPKGNSPRAKVRMVRDRSKEIQRKKKKNL